MKFIPVTTQVLKKNLNNNNNKKINSTLVIIQYNNIIYIITNIYYILEIETHYQYRLFTVSNKINNY